MSIYFYLSPAKINLTLQVLKKRPDGYHEIYSIFQKITLFDEIEIKKASSFSLDFYSEVAIPVEENLLYKAWKSFKYYFKISEEIKIKVIKRIPLGAGLGGGSSNAGTLLKALCDLYKVEKEKALPIATSLGADVPFFLMDYATAEGKGIGEILTPFPAYQAYYLLLYPNLQINTAWAYQQLNLTNEKSPIKYEASLPPWKQGSGLINDFKELIFKNYPQYREYEKALYEEGALAVSLSGTGSTIYGVYEEPPLFSASRLKKNLNNVKIFVAKNLDL
ncbi:MAG: 4-(cytidine 5'-diphospho)-2-C-methyl-D-erythritol kinase [Caldimicrobium sp.]